MNSSTVFRAPAYLKGIQHTGNLFPMDVREALKGQYHAGLAMLADCVQKCPEDLWIEGTYPRYFWRIAFHAAFFTHLYLGQNENSFVPWPEGKSDIYGDLWTDPSNVEPYELPDSAAVFSHPELLRYISFIDGLVDSTVDALNLETEDSGFSWYANFGKLAHQLLNLRHVQGHVGQLSELLMARGIDIDWVGKAAG